MVKRHLSWVPWLVAGLTAFPAVAARVPLPRPRWLFAVLPLMGLIGTAALQVACVIPVVYARRYPTTWPALKVIPQGECAEVAGTYSDLSLKENPKFEQVGLLETLLGDFGHRGPYPKSVRLEQPDAGTLVITALGEQGVLARQGLFASRGTLECTDIGLKIAVPTWVHPSDGGGSSRFFLNQSADGSLILRGVDKAIMGTSGVAILSYVRGWHRFPRVAAAVPRSASDAPPNRLPAYAPLDTDSPAESAVFRVARSCLKSSCLQRIIEMDSRTIVYNRRFDEALSEMRLPPSRYRIDTRARPDSSMEVELAKGLHYELHGEVCRSSNLPVQCPFRTEKVLTWVEELQSGSIAGGDTWWKEVTYREHLSPMVIDIPADGFWAADARVTREARLTADICDGVLIDRVVTKRSRGKIESNSESGEAQAVKFSVKLSFYNRSDGPRFVTPRLEVVEGDKRIVVMEHAREQVDRQRIKTLTLRSAPVHEKAFLALFDDEPEPILRITVAVQRNEGEAALTPDSVR